MLVLTRRIGETLMIGDDITITINAISHNQVRIGIDVPKDIAVHREEIHRRLQDEGKVASFANFRYRDES